MKKWRFLATAALALSLAACGSEAATEQIKEPVTEVQADNAITFTDALGVEHTFTAAPQTMATLNPGVMDILLALEGNVVGRPTISGEMEADVKAIQEIGNPHEPSFEQIVALKPDVLIVPTSFQRFASTIASTGIEVVYENMDSIEGIQQTITRYGELLGAEEKAATINADIDEAKAQTIDTTQNALIVYGAPGTYLAALDNSLYGDMLNVVGGHNIASNLPALDTYPTYANLSAEKIVEGNPQVIMLITHADPAMVQAGFEKQMNENAAWKNLDAVKNGNIVLLPTDLFDNPGTQVVEALAYMRELLEGTK